MLASRFVVSIAAVLGALGAVATAQVTSFTDHPSWAAAAGQPATIHFTEVPVGTVLGAHYAAQGLTFTDGADLVILDPAFVVDGTGVNGQGSIEVSFAAPKTSIGAHFPGALRIDLYSGPNLVGSSAAFGGMGSGFFGGVTSGTPFTRAVLVDWFEPVVFIDELHFGGGAAVSTYCTAGTTTLGCVPAVSWVGIPSAGASSGFVVRADALEGQRQGIFFYGVSGQNAQPWAVGSTSFLCVKAPLQRMNVQSSGGTSQQCDGSIAQDWHAFMAAQPGALGNPRAAGQSFDLQAWYRDPPAPKTTGLTDALHFVLAP
jgi:hypothetical protein